MMKSDTDLPRGGKKIAVSGKGGSGKTMLTALLVRFLSTDEGFRLLAIDADSSVSLSYALGMKVNQTVSEVRRRIIEDPNTKSEIENKHIRTVMEEILDTGSGFHLLTMGRPEGPGCFCAINDLLRYGIDTLSKRFDMTLIDCEAGPEQVNRRVVNGVDFLIIVTDASTRGMHTAKSIAEVVHRDQDMKISQMGLVVNRAKANIGLLKDMAQEVELDILGVVPEDATLAEYDSLGKPLVNLPATSPSVVAVQGILEKLLTQIDNLT